MMPEYLSQSDFGQLQQDFASGTVEITFPREVARQFFLRVPSSEVKHTTGESISLKKLCIWVSAVASPLMFAACIVFFVLDHSPWEASLILPIAGICWIVVYGLSSTQGGWLIGTIPLAITAIPIASDPSNVLEPVFLFVLSIWLQRTSFLLADQWMMSIIMQSYDAFEMLEEHIHIE